MDDKSFIGQQQVSRHTSAPPDVLCSSDVYPPMFMLLVDRNLNPQNTALSTCLQIFLKKDIFPFHLKKGLST